MPTNDSLNAAVAGPAQAGTHSDDTPTGPSLGNPGQPPAGQLPPTGDAMAGSYRPAWHHMVSFADIKPGDVVVQLGAGVEEACLGIRGTLGKAGRVIGIDTESAPLDYTHQNAAASTYATVELMQGKVEAIPLPGGVADVVVGNNALDGVSDRQAAFDEIYRILKPGGRSCLADLVLATGLPIAMQAATQSAGDMAFVTEQAYLEGLEMAGFETVEVQQRQPVEVPDEQSNAYLTDAQSTAFRQAGAGVISLISCAQKPGDEIPDLFHTDADAATEPDSDEDDLGDLKGFDFLGRL